MYRKRQKTLLTLPHTTIRGCVYDVCFCPSTHLSCIVYVTDIVGRNTDHVFTDIYGTLAGSVFIVNDRERPVYVSYTGVNVTVTFLVLNDPGSDYMSHNTAFVYSAQRIIVSFVRDHFPQVTRISYLRYIYL